MGLRETLSLRLSECPELGIEPNEADYIDDQLEEVAGR